MPLSPIFLTQIQKLAKSYQDTSLTNLADTFNDTLNGQFVLDIGQGGWNNERSVVDLFATDTRTTAAISLTNIADRNGVFQFPNASRIRALVLNMTNNTANPTTLRVQIKQLGTENTFAGDAPQQSGNTIFVDYYSLGANESREVCLYDLVNNFIDQDERLRMDLQIQNFTAGDSVLCDLNLLVVLNQAGLIVPNAK